MKVLILKSNALCKNETLLEIYNTFVNQIKDNGVAAIPTGFDYAIEDIDIPNQGVLFEKGEFYDLRRYLKTVQRGE